MLLLDSPKVAWPDSCGRSCCAEATGRVLATERVDGRVGPACSWTLPAGCSRQHRGGGALAAIVGRGASQREKSSRFRSTVWELPSASTRVSIAVLTQGRRCSREVDSC